MKCGEKKIIGKRAGWERRIGELRRKEKEGRTGSGSATICVKKPTAQLWGSALAGKSRHPKRKGTDVGIKKKADHHCVRRGGRRGPDRGSSLGESLGGGGCGSTFT